MTGPTTTPPAPAPRCRPIADIAGEPAGGKAQGLAELLELGLAVPPAFVVLDARADAMPPDLAAHYQALGGGPVAVRSSALGEDGAAASFAGQYETVLGVEGLAALEQAIVTCVRSLHTARAQAYQAAQAGGEESVMAVVVQRMVAPRAAGVLFTADPVSGRRDRMVIDAVPGIGEALMSGQQTPDHYLLAPDDALAEQTLAGTEAVLSAADLRALALPARAAAAAMGRPLDLEWAIDAAGALWWLQARPITTLPADLNELDTPVAADDVVTRCNIGEMMPGAVCPLTFSVQGRAIEHGMQHMQVCWGARPAITQEWTQVNQAFGHLFINLTQSLASSRYVGISTADQLAQSICGRSVPQLREPQPLAPAWRRRLGSARFMYYCLRARHCIAAFEPRLAAMRVRPLDDSRSMMAELDAKVGWLGATHEVHLRASAYSGVMEGVIQRLVSGAAPPTLAQQAQAARLLAGASEVESALLVAQLDRVVDHIARVADGSRRFGEATPAEALAWLRGPGAGAAGALFNDFLERHGHRGYRELCLREKAWADAPEKLVVTMQATLAARLSPHYRPKAVAPVAVAALPRALRWMLPRAHQAIRQREYTKSLLVDVTNRLKRGYRHLGGLLAREGHLPDADLVFFFTHDELTRFCAAPARAGADHALARRRALAYQDRLHFADVMVGSPRPLPAAPPTAAADTLAGRPVSGGVVEGLARVCHTVDEAAALKPGEILVAPITDVGWTPYFSLIAGLATEVGSAVSHGAVIAREYGLPAVVNLANATSAFRTGDRVRLDADRGLLTRLAGAADDAAAADAN